jgi:DNA-binding MarR family transcriptional regulator
MSARDLRLREQYFPGAEKRVFSTGKGGFAPMPIIHRKLLRYLTAPEFRVFLYLILRISQEGICYPSYDEMLHDLKLTRRNLEPHLKALAEKGFISRATGEGKPYFLVHDPRIAIEHLVSIGTISDAELAEINGLLRDLKQQAVRAAAPASTVPPMNQQQPGSPVAKPSPAAKPNAPIVSGRQDHSTGTPDEFTYVCTPCRDKGSNALGIPCLFCDKGRSLVRELEEARNRIAARRASQPDRAANVLAE